MRARSCARGPTTTCRARSQNARRSSCSRTIRSSISLDCAARSNRMLRISDYWEAAARKLRAAHRCARRFRGTRAGANSRTRGVGARRHERCRNRALDHGGNGCGAAWRRRNAAADRPRRHSSPARTRMPAAHERSQGSSRDPCGRRIVARRQAEAPDGLSRSSVDRVCDCGGPTLESHRGRRPRRRRVSRRPP